MTPSTALAIEASASPSPVERTSAGSTVDLLVFAAAAGLALFAWLTPNHYPPWVSFHGEASMALAALLLAGWLCWRAFNFFATLPWLSAVAFAGMVVPFVQFAVGQVDFFGDVWLTSLYFFAFGLAAWCGQASAGRFGFERTVEPVTWIVFVAALVSTWMALYQWQGLEYFEFFVIDIAEGVRPYANLVQPNHLATLVVLGMLASAFLFERGRIGRGVALAVVGVLAFGLAMTQSRTGLIEVAVAAALLVAQPPSGLSTRLKRLHIGVAVGIVAVMPMVWEAMRSVSASPSGHAIGEIAQVGTRPIHWLSMLDAIGRHPWIGYGSNQLGAAQYLVAVDHAAPHETLAYSHNLILDLLVWNGIPIGGLLFAGLAFWFFLASRRALGATRGIVLASIAAAFVHAMLEFPLYYMYFLLPIASLMGALSQGSPGCPTFKVKPIVAPVLVAVAGMLLVATAVDYFRLEGDVRQMRFFQARIQNGEGGMKLNPSRKRILSQFTHFWDFAITPEKRGMSDVEMHETQLVTLRFPSKENMLRYAEALALNGKPDEAQDVLRRVCRVNPDDGCQLIKRIWKARGRKDEEIRRIPWPAD